MGCTTDRGRWLCRLSYYLLVVVIAVALYLDRGVTDKDKARDDPPANNR